MKINATFRSAKMYFKIISRVKEGILGAKLLEIGPGHQYFFADMAVSSGFDYEAIEGNEEYVKVLQKKGFKVYQSFLPDFPDLTTKYDVIVCTHVLEHLSSYKDVHRSLIYFHELLKPDGIVLIAGPAINDRSFYENAPDHDYITTPFRMRTLLSACGYEISSAKVLCAGYDGIFAQLLSFLAALIPAPLSFAFSREGSFFHSIYKAKMALSLSYCIVSKKK